MKKLKIIICVVLSIFLIVGVFVGTFLYKTRHQSVKLDTSISPDENYELTLFSVGEPDFPFGYAHGKITLKSDGNTISETEIDLAYDGGQITKDSWKVLWKEDYAKVYLYASEQPNEVLHFYFDGEIEQKPQKFQTYEDSKLKLDTFKSKEEFTAFSADINNYIEVMNRYYHHYHPYDYLYDVDEWKKYEEKTKYHGYNSKCYHFVRDNTINCLPNVSVYTPDNEAGIFEVKLTFDDHGFQEDLYKEYMEITKGSLKAFLPKLSFDEIDSLYDKVYSARNENFWGDHTDNSDPARQELKKIFCYENIGIYSYYGAGTVNICIIPVTDEIIEQLTAKGVKIEGINQPID